MNPFRLTVVYLSVLQHKLVSSLTRCIFTVRITVGVITTDKVMWLRADLTAFTVSKQILILSVCDKLHLKPRPNIAESYLRAGL
jgi:hypothetical protein